MSQTTAFSTTLVASSVSANVFAGNPFEFLAAAARLSLFASISAAGAAATWLVGGKAICQELFVPVTNRFPIRPDDGIAQVAAPGGSRLYLTYRETAGATPSVITLLDIDFIPVRRR